MSATNSSALHSRARTSSNYENRKLGMARRSTPDSEALLSSDDDHEVNPSMSLSLQSVQSVPTQRPARRGSWLSEVRTAQRKYSLGGISLASANGNSQPPTPSAENGHPLERPSSHGQSGPSMLPWDNTANKAMHMTNSVWRNTGSQSTSNWSKKEGSRWSEVLSTSAYSSPIMDDLRSPRTVTAGESTAPPPPQSTISTTGFPFDIPLEPNRKTVRSQSYSAGQLDLSSSNDSSLPARFKPKRALAPSLSRRKSRPAMDSGTEFDLAAVQEDPEMQVPYSESYNATSSPYSERARTTARHPSTISLDAADLTRSMSYPHAEHGPDERSSYTMTSVSANVPPIANAIADAEFGDRLINNEEAQPQQGLANFDHSMTSAYPYSSMNRRYSPETVDHGVHGGFVDASTYQNIPQVYGMPQYSHPIQSHGQGHQSYDFMVISDISQHSANIPPFGPRRSSFGSQRTASSTLGVTTTDVVPENVVTQSIRHAALEVQSILAESEKAANIPSFENPQNFRRSTGLHRSEGSYHMSTHDKMLQDTAQSPTKQERNLPFPDLSPKHDFSTQARHLPHNQPPSGFESLHQHAVPSADDMMDMYGSNGPQTANGKTNRNLYLVTFKASRAEIFFRPAGFVGELLEGYMVIVEGDRGQDMGMIAHTELDHEQAKALKAEYNRKHYHTLVRFSRNYPHLAESIVNDPDYEERAAQNLADQTLGPLGAPSTRGSNLSPRAIRRVATDREVMLLRDKEGNEARAKRICQGKVNTQHLSMEILDAEFQLDYNKLTFYFYAEEYIPFNAIVTDLFKVWKTRIWLSAVNPDTYPAPPRRPGDASRQPRREGRGHDPRRDHSYHSTASAARRAYIRGAQDLAMGQFPGSLAATFQHNAYSQQQHQMQQQQAAFSPPGQVVLPQGGPFTSNRRQPQNNLTFGSMPPPMSSTVTQHAWATAAHSHPTSSTGLTSPSLLRAAPAVADALASRRELPPAFVPSGQHGVLPGLGNLSLDHRQQQ